MVQTLQEKCKELVVRIRGKYLYEGRDPVWHMPDHSAANMLEMEFQEERQKAYKLLQTWITHFDEITKLIPAYRVTDGVNERLNELLVLTDKYINGDKDAPR